MTPHPHATEAHVLAVLAGTPLGQAAARIPMDPADLTDAVEVYQAAGRAALEAQARARGWYQVRLQFADWSTAEHNAATHLSPWLRQAQEAGTLTGWWFLRKHPCWRLRCRPGPTTTQADLATAAGALLNRLIADGIIERWRESCYEPEAFAFGGSAGMAIAHHLFHADSHGVLAYLRHHGPAGLPKQRVGRREVSVLLCTTLFRGARQDAQEQGDIWHRVAGERPLSAEPPPDRLRGMIPKLRQLMNLDATPNAPLFATDGPLPFAAPWSDAFATAGRHLADTARDGTLQRGLRAILTNHVIFHWNRLGLPTATQAILARAARETLMNPPLDPAGA